MSAPNGDATSRAGWPHGGSPYHPGEQWVQERAGTREFAERMGRKVIRDHMPDQHRAFFAMLPFVFVGSLDAERRPWASIVAGEPGFLSSPDANTLRLQATG